MLMDFFMTEGRTNNNARHGQRLLAPTVLIAVVVYLSLCSTRELLPPAGIDEKVAERRPVGDLLLAAAAVADDAANSATAERIAAAERRSVGDLLLAAANVADDAANSATAEKIAAEQRSVGDVLLEAVTVADNAANSATGILFSGQPFRLFSGERHFSEGWEKIIDKTANGDDDAGATSEHCDRWAVVTTISGPTEAVKVVAELPGKRLAFCWQTFARMERQCSHGKAVPFERWSILIQYVLCRTVP